LDLKGNEVQLDFTKLPSLTKLEYLRMSGTGMSSMVGLSRGTVLKAFHATNNELRNVPEELFSMVHLESLFLSYNSVTGTISRRFGQMSSLKELYMFGNRLTGSIPSELGRLTDLTELVLAHNYLSGIVPDELSFLPNLEQMSIFDQQGVELITGPVPTFSGASKLWYFDASNNDLTGPMPGNFMMNAASTNASIEIFLRNNEITGTVPAALSRFESLNIDLADNKIMEIPPVLCQIGGWMEGKAQLVGTCNAILCPKGHFNQFGHESPGNPCLPCDNLKDDQYLGKIRCEDFTSERDTLNKIFHESGGEFWSNATNWKTEAPICSWEGVLCENGDLQDSEGITLLRLDNNGLSGTLPSEVWTLPSLRYLSLKNNPNLFVNFDGLENAAETLEVLYLTETGLASLGGISAATRLQELHLTGNDIKGTFPEELFALSNTLQSLYLANNLFYGSLPTKLGKMSNLRAFYAFENNFMSTIPSELGRLKYLKVLGKSCFCRCFCGFRSTANVCLLVLAENMMYGQIPQELSAMPELEVFAAFRREKSGPRLTGTLPSFDKLPQLKELYLQGNDIHGTVPESFVSASRSIEVIRLGSNILTGTVPGDFGQLPKLNLELEGNMIEGFPASFCLNKDWMEGAIDSYGCNAFLCPPGSASASGRAVNASTTCGICSKEGAAQYYGSTSCDGSLSEREILVNLFYALNGNLWYRNDFWGSTADICDWYGIGCVGGHVVIINLRGNNLQGLPGPDLFHLPELRTIWLYSNPLQFSFENIGSAKKLQDLRLDSTLLHSLHGIGSAKSLISFDAGFTALRGPFPENEILALSNLRNLQLNDNSFSGTLPKSFTQLKFLINLRLDSNRFTGTLPFFDDMHFLEYVDFSNNVLNGPISRKFFGKLALDARPTIRLARNQLTGVIPEEFDRFQDMTVHFSDNQILGLPVVLCDNKKWNNGDVGKYGCDAIMCTPGTSNPQGRRTPNSKCRQCKGASYYGDTSCQSDPSSAVQLQQQLFIIAALLTMTALHFV
jgi:Leucine-rich repeat (LRR) protein